MDCFLAERPGELGDKLREERGIAIGDALDINLSSKSGQVNANPVPGLMTQRTQERSTS